MEKWCGLASYTAGGQKKMTNPNLKTSKFCFTRGRSSERVCVLCDTSSMHWRGCWTGPLNGHWYPVTSFMSLHWALVWERRSVCSSHIEERRRATACSKAEFGMKNIRCLWAAVSSESKFWPQVLKFCLILSLHTSCYMNLSWSSKCCSSQHSRETTHNNVGADWAGVNSKGGNNFSQKENVSIS